MTRQRSEGVGRRNGQWMPAICGGCGAQVSQVHKTPRAEAECRAESLGCTILPLDRPPRHADPFNEAPRMEVEAPDGQRFDDELHALVCFDWKDVRDRLRDARLTPCPDDCDCKA